MNHRETTEHQNKGYTLVICPICGKETLDNFWICSTCQWEYDGVTDDDTYSVANKATVREYRQTHGY